MIYVYIKDEFVHACTEVQPVPYVQLSVNEYDLTLIVSLEMTFTDQMIQTTVSGH